MVEDETELLPQVAAALIEWIPELNGRAIAISEADITPETVPTLPIALVAPLQQTFTHNGGHVVNTVEEFVIEVWLKPIREKTSAGAETPFWSYYEYNKFRNNLFTRFLGWRSTLNGTLRFISFDIEANTYAVVLTFRMSIEYKWCPNADELNACDAAMRQDGNPIKGITFALCTPKAETCCDNCETNETEKDPCP